MEWHQDRFPPEADRVETRFGVLYRPKSFVVQLPFLIGAFLGGPAAGWILGMILGGVSENGQIFLYASTTLIFFFGYALWAARLAALAFEAFGKHILRALFQLIVKRKRPESVEALIPSRDKLEELVVRAQKAAWSFFVVSIPLGLVGGILARLLETQSEKWLQSIVVSTGCVLWGSVLSLLGRRGCLPLPEPED